MTQVLKIRFIDNCHVRPTKWLLLRACFTSPQAPPQPRSACVLWCIVGKGGSPCKNRERMVLAGTGWILDPIMLGHSHLDVIIHSNPTNPTHPSNTLKSQSFGICFFFQPCNLLWPPPQNEQKKHKLRSSPGPVTDGHCFPTDMHETLHLTFGLADSLKGHMGPPGVSWQIFFA